MAKKNSYNPKLVKTKKMNFGQRRMKKKVRTLGKH